jgi:CTP:molybdopterin cytidylyltransferase MocA
MKSDVIASALLAAGGSRRLGRPKQLLSIDGKPLVVHVLAQLQAAASGPCAVIIGSSADELRDVLAATGCEVLENSSWTEGIASSIRTAVDWAAARGATGLILAACDQPKLGPEHVRALVDTRARVGATAASGYAGTCGIPAIFDASWYPRLRSLTGDRGAGALLRSDPNVAVVAWPDGAFDIDTPEDAAAFGLR